MVERGGNVIAKVVPNTRTNTLLPHILQNVKSKTHIMTDEWVAYNSLDNHKVYFRSHINHSQKEYDRGNVHTNQ